MDVAGAAIPPAWPGLSLASPLPADRVRVGQMKAKGRSATYGGEYKLIELPLQSARHESPAVQLFHRLDDAAELRNLAELMPEKVAELREQFQRFQDRYPATTGGARERQLAEAEVEALQELGYLIDED
jgi:hypothetical protein